MSLNANVLGAAAFAFGAGVTTFFSPCAYPLLPGYVGYYASQTAGEQDEGSFSGAVVRGVAASLGVLVVFGILLAVIAAVGHSAVSRLSVFEPVIGLLLVAFGVLTLTDTVPELTISLPERRTTIIGFVAFGVVYAVAAAGCVLPVFAGVVLQALTLPISASIVVVGAYAIGIAGLMTGMTVVTGLGVTVETGLTRYVGGIVRVAGVVMIVAGLGQLYLSIAVLHVI